MNPMQLKDRAVGTIAGFAIGDALGMPAQFLSRDQLKRYYGKPIAGFVKAHPGHASDFLPEGSYTDDTQMMLATSECLIECGKMDPARQAEALLNWYQNTSPHRTPMNANLRACKHLSTGRPWSKSGVFSCGCGAAVRMPPIGIVYWNHPDAMERAALDNCLITHTEPRARAASVAVASLIARLVQATDRCSPGEQILETADRVSSHDPDFAAMLRWVTQMVHQSPEEALFEIGTSSDAIEAVPAAVYCFLKYPRQFSRAVTAAVNGGEASDSIAALTGSFVGAYSGLQAIESHWLKEVENPDILMAAAESLAALASHLEPLDAALAAN